MNTPGFVYHEDYLKHQSGPGHPESPQRLESVVNHLQQVGLLSELVLIAPTPAELRWVEEIHSPDYITHVREACQKGIYFLDSFDTGICPESYRIALLAVGGVLNAVDQVMQGKVRSAFCAVRPPGHHAERSCALGFCLFNNIAIAAKYIQKQYNLPRVLIIDWDVHHGNGTQHAFYRDPTVFYFSIHQYPHYPGTGSQQERGEGKGLGFTLNMPVPAGSRDDDYVRVFEKELLPAAKEFRPDFILISAGFDAHQNDPLSGISITENGIKLITQMIKDLAEKTCKGRIVSVLEGGYDLKALAQCVEAHINVLKNQ